MTPAPGSDEAGECLPVGASKRPTAIDALIKDFPYGSILGVQMPEMDGLVATAIIRAELPPDRQPPIVALTASVLAEDRAACAQAGMDAYLTKPIRSEELGAALSHIRPRARHSQKRAVLRAATVSR